MGVGLHEELGVGLRDLVAALEEVRHRRDVLGRPLREVCLHDAGQGLDDEDASEVGLEQDVLLVAAAHRVLLGVEEEELWVGEPQQVELELLEVQPGMVCLQLFLELSLDLGANFAQVRVILLLHDAPSVSEHDLEALRNFHDEALEVQLLQEDRVVEGLLEGLESCQRTENVRRHREQVAGLRVAQAVAQLVPHLLDLFFVGREGHAGAGFAHLGLHGQAQVVEELFQVEFGIADALRLNSLLAGEGLSPPLQELDLLQLHGVDGLIVVSDLLCFLDLAAAEARDLRMVQRVLGSGPR